MATVSFLQERLEQGLKAVQRAVANRSTMPVLANVLFDVNGGVATLVGNNLEFAIAQRVGCKTTGDVAFTLPYTLLLGYVSALPAERIDIEWDEPTATAAISCGNFEANIKGIEAVEFPNFDLSEDDSVSSLVKIPGDTLQDIIDYTAFAAATNESRPILTGVKVTMLDNKLSASAADGFRLSFTEYELGADAVIQPEVGIEAIIPAKALIVLAGLTEDDDTVKLFLTHSQAVFSGETWQMAIQLLEGKFPDLTAIIPTEPATTVLFGVGTLKEATNVANLFSKDAANIVSYKFSESGLEIQATSQEMGDHTSQVPLMGFEGDDVEIAFNGRYMSEYLSKLHTVGGVLKMSGKTQPGLFTSDYLGFTHVIMPMHLSR